MSTRALVPEGVEVHQNDLAGEIAARIADHIQALQDVASMGVVSGLVVSVGAVDNTRVDVTAGACYVPSGEYTELDVGQGSVALADASLGAINYVVLVYTEVQSDPQPHETGGSSPYTLATRSSRLRVYTQAQYNALVASSDDLAVDAQDRTRVIAIVTGTGGVLTAGSIELPTSFNTINYASATQNVTGVAITAVSSDTEEGTGTLDFEFATTELTWTPPGGSAGTPVNVGGGGAFVLSGGGADPPTLGVQVIASSLPTADRSDSIVITSLYSQDVARFTADDQLHRSMLGTGTPSPTNPHGLRVTDLGGAELEELVNHRDIQHSNGIWRGSSAGCLAVTINEAAAPDQLDITAPACPDTYFVNGYRLDAITASSLTFGSAPAEAVLYEVVVDSEGAPSLSARATWPAGYGSSSVTGVYIIDVSDETPVGSYDLTFAVATTTLRWDSGPTVDVSAGGWFRLVGQNDRDVVDVFVVAGSLPAGNATDSIAIGALASQDTYMRVAMLPWTGSATGFLGYTPTRGAVTARAIDKRFYGTLSWDDRQDEKVEARVVPVDGSAPTILRRTADERNLSELRDSGVLMGLGQADTNSLAVSDAGGLNVNVAGGVGFIFGRRTVRAEQTGFALADDATSFVYLDADGTLTASTTLTLRQIVGAPIASGGDILNNPGRGIVLAKVVTAAGDIVEIIDYRRNITRLDNLEYMGVASPTLGAGPRAQFCSLRAAIDYCINVYGRNEVRVVGGFTEALTSPIGLTSQFRIVLEPDSTVNFTDNGASSVFSLSSSGALELRGTGLITTEMDLIAYGSNSNGYVLIEGVKITLNASCAVIAVSSSTADERGIQVHSCNIDSSGFASDLFDFTTGFDGPFVLRDSRFDSLGILLNANLGAADSIEQATIANCAGSVARVVSTDVDTTLNDLHVEGCVFETSGSSFRLSGPTARARIRDNTITSTGSYCVYLVDSSHSNMTIEGNVLDSDVTSDGIKAEGTVTSSRLSIRGNKFITSYSTGIAIDLPVSTATGITISDNHFVQGSIDVENVLDLNVSDNTWVAQATSGSQVIALVNCDRFTVADNYVRYTTAGLDIDAASDQGTISGNTFITTSTTADQCILCRGDRVAITGNTIDQSSSDIGGATDRTGIYSSGSNCAITGNVIRLSESGSLTTGVWNTGYRTSITGNTIEFTSASAAGRGIYNSDSAPDCAIVGNQVYAQPGPGCVLTSIYVHTSATNCVVTGNKVSATGAAADILADAARCAVVGNVISTTNGDAGANISVGGAGSSNTGNVV